MQVRTEKEVLDLIASDLWMMFVLRTARSLQLADWWICAGFVRSKIWYVLHDYSKRTPLPDVDVIYFDAENISTDQEKKREYELNSIQPSVPWSVKNEARMHLRNGDAPYISSEDAIAHFPETATAVGVKLNGKGKLVLTAPHGLKDLLGLTVRPTIYFDQNSPKHALYKERIAAKQWEEKWPKLQLSR